MQQIRLNHFATRNVALAAALATVGCERAEVPVVNVYDAKHKYAPGRPGETTFFFKRSRKLERCIKAWNKAEAAETGLTAEQEVNIMAVFARNRTTFANAWRQAPPQARLHLGADRYEYRQIDPATGQLKKGTGHE